MQHDKPIFAPPSVVTQGKSTDHEAGSEGRTNLEEQDSVLNELLSMEVTRRRELLAPPVSSFGTSGSEGSEDQYYTLVDPYDPTKTFEMSTEQYRQIMSRFTAERAQRSNPGSRTVSRNPSEAQVTQVTDKGTTPTSSRDLSRAVAQTTNPAISSDGSNHMGSHERKRRDDDFFSHGSVFSRNAPSE
ncbi:hypothetical protein V866_006481 [Kwoniella sp. B9012]|uniref:Uncharacterized protein n=1 Tax=Kwoniella europaea PYCC6329 TaxID=1423913 RepID=A0AAX4KUN2_9TREE